MIELRLDAADLTRLERALVELNRDQIPYAMSRALNDCAKAAVKAVNTAMAETFDRPTPFTSRAAVAPRAMAATKTNLSAEVTLRPIQGQYLQLEETGGTRTGAMNTNKPSKKILLPGKTLPLNQFGNIPKGILRAIAAQASASAGKSKRTRTKAPDADANSVVLLHSGDKGNKARVTGWFRRLSGHHLVRLTAFEKETHYAERMGYHAHVEASVRGHWPAAMLARLIQAIQSRH